MDALFLKSPLIVRLNRVWFSKALTRMKVRKTARIRNRYNQVPHLSKTINITNKSQEVSPFPSGDHMAAMNRRESMTITRHK